MSGGTGTGAEVHAVKVITDQRSTTPDSRPSTAATASGTPGSGPDGWFFSESDSVNLNDKVESLVLLEAEVETNPEKLEEYTKAVDDLIILVSMQSRKFLSENISALPAYAHPMSQLCESLVRISHKLDASSPYFGANHDHKSDVGSLALFLREFETLEGLDEKKEAFLEFLSAILYSTDITQNRSSGKVDLGMLKSIFKSKYNDRLDKITIEIKGPETVFAKDRGLLWSCLHNLMSNAVKNSGVTSIIIDAASVGEISVINNGEQIRAEIVEKLNRRFQGGEESFEAGESNSGKGTQALVSKGAVGHCAMRCEQHGDVGAKVTVGYVDASPAPVVVAEAAALESKEDSVGKSSILFADDNRVNQRMGARFLKGLGHEVIAVDDGGKLLANATASNANYDVIITDDQMPVKNGSDAAIAVRTEHPAMPIVLATATADEAMATFCRDNKIAHLVKPYDKAAFAEAIQAAKDLLLAPAVSPAHVGVFFSVEKEAEMRGSTDADSLTGNAAGAGSSC